MILYTPLSEHDVYPPDTTNLNNCEIITHEGKMLQVERLENGTCRVLKMMSTNPQDYLDNRYYPGEVISYF